jgi:hypothetical protein
MLDNLYVLSKTGYQPLLVQTPIPGAVWLFASAFAGFVSFGRRRKNQS